MDYQHHYNLLIERARSRLLEGYRELHHIIPRCLGGTDEPNNLVYLTAKEHYVAHQLLVKIHPTEPKLVYAAKMMSANPWGKRGTNRLYGWLRERFISSMTGENNPNYGKTFEEIVGQEKAKEFRKNHPLRGKTLEEILGKDKAQAGIQSRRAFRIGKKHSAKTRKNISVAMKGKNKGKSPWNKGISPSEETRKKMSETMKGKLGWFTNGKEDRYVKIDEPPEGWSRGRSNIKIGRRT